MNLIGIKLMIVGSAIGFSSLQISPAEKLVAPPVPSIPPVIGATYSNDMNADALEDELAERIQLALGLLASGTTEQDRAARAQLLAPVELELIFRTPISQGQIDTFLAFGGEITHIYKAVSYGWNGRLPLGRIPDLKMALGNSLVLIEEARLAQAHMDLATRSGRVRPIWGAGFAGSSIGFNGATNITIAIVDSGIDETHPDLAGRRVFWQDYSTDAAAAPIDISQHGTHVSSIALGTGDASGNATGDLFATLTGNLTGIFSGNFFTTPMPLPSVSITFTATARWAGGGTGTLQLMSHSRGTKSAYVLEGAGVSGVSPLTLIMTVTGDQAKEYSPVLVSNGAMSNYVINYQIPNYPGVDSFNRMRGVASECLWASAKVFQNNGNGLLTWTAAAVDDLVASRVTNNIKVMNLSLGASGSPGISTSTRQKINSAVNNGVLVTCSGGNDGLSSPATARETDDPGRAAFALTVVAANELNQLTDYSSQGFGTPSSVAGQEEDFKPDLMAPGGSSFFSSIYAADSNSGDGATFPDQQPNDYWHIQGTSAAAPFAAGCAALVIDALQQSGRTWDFASADSPMLVKMLLSATASESNSTRENGSVTLSPTLQRSTAGTNGFPIGKDQYEGYGMINPDAAVEAVSQELEMGITNSVTLGPTATDRRVWARKLSLVAGVRFVANLTVPASGDFDLCLYSFVPGIYGRPQLLASSTLAGPGIGEALIYEATTNVEAFLVVKRIAGSGTFDLFAAVPPDVAFDATPTSGISPLAVAFTNNSTRGSQCVWNFGDGSGAAEMNPEHLYTNAGTFSVTLTAANIAGTNRLTRTNLVSVATPGKLVVLTTSLDFGVLLPGSLNQSSMALSNASTAMVMGSATVSPGDFSLVAGTPFGLGPNGVTNLILSFAPQTQGVFNGVVTIVSDGGASTNTLTGRAAYQPLISSPIYAAGNFGFMLPTLAGFDYDVQFKANLEDPVWSDVLTESGDGTQHLVNLSSTNSSQGFYRVIVH